MNDRIVSHVLSLVLVALSLVACSAPAATPTATPVPPTEMPRHTPTAELATTQALPTVVPTTVTSQVLTPTPVPPPEPSPTPTQPPGWAGESIPSGEGVIQKVVMAMDRSGVLHVIWGTSTLDSTGDQYTHHLLYTDKTPGSSFRDPVEIWGATSTRGRKSFPS